ncbi:hypothetical protein Hbl1158_15090 (plasmid) [Halobaculum sp. CBA1158]|uniref:hypothetical protein n=1 Tax=Halobaculum sp. CBA1158 TaxID=2904243 RepID=UPI001F31D4E5|nr:hypothetical protein [Halobaculum sp. CBA1158]UIP01460.1 hypothetical protein Hbl1158_15090 [Halobaculum sp. CBA1158]
MSAPLGRSVDPQHPESVRAGVAEIVAEFAIPDDGRPVVVADLPYPYHTSTGMVANPVVVGAVVETLRDATDGPVGLAVSTGDHADADRAASLVGYDERVEAAGDAGTGDARTGGVERLDLRPGETPDRTVTVDGGERTVDVPAALVDRPVVAVPSLRYGTDAPVATATATVARHARVSPTAARSVAAAALAVDPAGAVLDGTYSYTGEPRATGVVVGGDAPVVDRFAAWLVGVDPGDVPALAALPGPDEPPRLRSIDAGAIRASLPRGPRPTRGTPGPAVRRAYRLYTDLTGDAYPPQLDP